MIDFWINEGARWRERPCWKHLLIAIDAGEGGAKPAFAEDLAKELFPGKQHDLMKGTKVQPPSAHAQASHM